MQFFPAVILSGVIAYELHTGTIPVKYGLTVSRNRSVSRSEKLFQFWLWVVVQAAVLVAFLSWPGIIKI